MKMSKAIVLGGTYAHIPLIKKLKKLNFYVLLIDYNINPPAKNYADVHLLKSTLEKEEVLEIAIENNVEFIISTSIDRANTVAFYVLEKLNKKVPLSYEKSNLINNKLFLKKVLNKNNIKTPKYITVQQPLDNVSKIIRFSKLNFPLISKPIDNNGSKGVLIIDKLKNIQIPLEESFKYSKQSKVILEEFILGDEFSIDAFIDFEGEIHILTIRRRFKLNIDNINQQQIVGSLVIENISSVFKNQLLDTLKKIAKSLNLSNVPFMMQFIYTNKILNIIEFAVRIGGGESYYINKLKTNIDLIDLSMNSFLGKFIKPIIKYSKLYVCDLLIYSHEGTIKKIEGLEFLKENSMIADYHIYKSVGMHVQENFISSSRVGAIIITSSSRQQLIYKITQALNSIKIIDTNKVNIFRSDIYTEMVSYLKC